MILTCASRVQPMIRPSLPFLSHGGPNCNTSRQARN